MVVLLISKQAEQWTSALADVATVVALALGGWWTYSRFIKNRDDKPRAEITLQIDDRPLTDRINLARASVVVRNAGPVLLPMRSVRCEAYRVTPAASETVDKLDACQLVEEHEADLPVIRRFDRVWELGEAEIEPGESDTSAFDFVLDDDVETILVYAYVCNSTKESVEIGWECSRFYDLVSRDQDKGVRND